ncbi:MAG: TraR/DksA family transcriptional regulator [Candidatus Acidiferrales bacterium]
MASTARIPHSKYTTIERQLASKRDELRVRLDEHRTEVFIEREPDDAAAEANRNLAKDLALATLDRERHTLQEIDLALDRIKTGEYGICDVCGDKIPEARIRALPWTRFCLACAEQRGSLNSAASSRL